MEPSSQCCKAGPQPDTLFGTVGICSLCQNWSRFVLDGEQPADNLEITYSTCCSRPAKPGTLFGTVGICSLCLNWSRFGEFHRGQ